MPCTTCNNKGRLPDRGIENAIRCHTCHGDPTQPPHVTLARRYIEYYEADHQDPTRRPMQTFTYARDQIGKELADWIVKTQVGGYPNEKCGKHGCKKQAVEKVHGDLLYYACEDHYNEILELTKNE